MPMLPTTLANQIINLPLTMDVNIAIEGWANAWIEYFSQSSAGPVPCVKPVLFGLPKTLMKAAMTTLSTTGAVALQNGILAFWGGVSASFALVYPTATAVTPPPGLSGLSTALIPVFAANTIGSLSRPVSANAISVVMHTLNLGGTATIIAPPPVPIL